MFQQIGHMLFPIWVAGCLFACLVNAVHFRGLLLCLLYLFVPVLMFQFHFDGMAQLFRWKWYLLVSGTEIYIILLALGSEVKATKYLVYLACISILINLTYLPFYISGHPLPRQAYFVTVSGIQALQIGSLIVFAPLWPFLKTRIHLTRKRNTPWMGRIASGAQ